MSRGLLRLVTRCFETSVQESEKEVTGCRKMLNRTVEEWKVESDEKRPSDKLEIQSELVSPDH